MLTSEVLRKAKALIDSPDKWGKAKPWRNKMCSGTTCVDVAIAAVSSDAERRPAVEAFTAFLPSGESDPFVRIWNWNDAEERTHEDVMVTFARAIEYAEARERTVARVVSGFRWSHVPQAREAAALPAPAAGAVGVGVLS